MTNKKGISPVIASALIITIAVLSIVNFQNWFSSFSTTKYVEIEEQSLSTENLKIETIIGTEIYLKNFANSNLTIKKIQIGDSTCKINQTIKPSKITFLNLTNCKKTITPGNKEIIIITNQGTITKYLPIKEEIFSCVGDNVLNVGGNCWQKNLNTVASIQWSTNNNYKEPIWNSQTKKYSYPDGTISDYPVFQYCENLELDEYTDWKVPTAQDWINVGSLIDFFSPRLISELGFTNLIPLAGYLTSDEDPDTPTNAQVVGLSQFMLSGSFLKNDTRSKVICVRG